MNGAGSVVMADTSAQLAGRIRLGEDSSLELKEVTVAGGRITGPRRDQLADELAAFANANGGTLVLGVEDRTRRINGSLCRTWIRQSDSLRRLCRTPLLPRWLRRSTSWSCCFPALIR